MFALHPSARFHIHCGRCTFSVLTEKLFFFFLLRKQVYRQNLWHHKWIRSQSCSNTQFTQTWGLKMDFYIEAQHLNLGLRFILKILMWQFYFPEITTKGRWIRIPDKDLQHKNIWIEDMSWKPCSQLVFFFYERIVECENWSWQHIKKNWRDQHWNLMQSDNWSWKLELVIQQIKGSLNVAASILRLESLQV